MFTFTAKDYKLSLYPYQSFCFHVPGNLYIFYGDHWLHFGLRYLFTLHHSELKHEDANYRHSFKHLSQMWQFVSEFQQRCRVSPAANWGVWPRPFVWLSCLARNSGGCDVASVALCPRRAGLLGQFWAPGTDDVSACNVLISVERLSLSHFLRQFE